MRTSDQLFGRALVQGVAVVSFAFILAMPVSQGTVLIIVFVLMALGSGATILSTGRTMSPPVIAVAWLTLMFGVIGLWVGAENPGFGNALGVFVGAPLLFFVCVNALGRDSIRLLLYTNAIISVVIGSYICVYVAEQFGLIPQIIPDWLLSLTGAGFDSLGDVTTIRFYGLSTLAATAPMWLASLLVTRDSMLPPRALRVSAAVAGVFGAVAGGRKAIILVVVLMPLIAWVAKRSTGRSRYRKVRPGVVMTSIAVVGVGVLALSLTWSISILGNFWDAIVSFFTGTAATASTDQSIRVMESDRLIEAWQQSPLLGRGLGAGVEGFVRSPVQPWQYELQYQTLLMQTGIIGAGLLIAIAVVVVRAVSQAARKRPDLTPSLVVTLSGGIAMLIANATDPYLQAPANQWAIFLPLAVINLMLREPPPGIIVEEFNGRVLGGAPAVA